MKQLALLFAIYVVIAALVLPSSILAQEEGAPAGTDTTSSEPAAPAAPSEPAGASDPEAPDQAAPESLPAQTAPGEPASSEPAPAPAPAAPVPAEAGQPAPQFLADERAESSEPKATAAASGGVTIADYSFSPATITISEGDTVTWTNNGPTPHSATASDGSFDTGIFPKGQSRSQTFTVPGSYSYFCTPHPQMKGTVVVQAAQTSGATGETNGGTVNGTGEADAAQADDGPALPNSGSDAGALLLLGALMLMLGVAVHRRARAQDPQAAGRIGW